MLWGLPAVSFSCVSSPLSLPCRIKVSYLTWGVLQERVMTRSYGATATSPGERFSDSQFLVLMNRILALMVAGVYCILCKQPRHGAPMYRYSFASLSNVLSSCLRRQEFYMES